VSGSRTRQVNLLRASDPGAGRRAARHKVEIS